MPSLNDFRFPVRDADIFFNDDPTYTADDKMADADFNQRAVEDYLSNTLPNVYISQSDLGSGIIDQAQLATGSAASGTAPVSDGAGSTAWTDIATQTELNAHESDTTNVHGIADTANVVIIGTDLQRGVTDVADMNGTNTVFAVAFQSAFAAVPRVTATVECGRRIGFFPTIISVNTTSFVGMVWTFSSTTATARVHYHAVKA